MRSALHGLIVTYLIVLSAHVGYHTVAQQAASAVGALSALGCRLCCRRRMCWLLTAQVVFLRRMW